MKKRAHSKSGKEEKNRVLLFPQLLRWSDYFHLKKSNSSFTKVKLQDVLNCLKFKNELYVYVNLRKKRDRDFILFLCVLEAGMNVLARISICEFIWGIRSLIPIWKIEGCPSLNTLTIFTHFSFSFYQRRQKYKIVIVLFSATLLPLTHSFVFNYIKIILLIFQDS